MRIIIVGSGSAGRQLAGRLCEERNDVTLIDRDSEALKQLDSSLDILTIHGEGSNPRILEEAHIERTDLLVALTNSDETNVLACMLANAAGVKSKIARINSYDYLREDNVFDLRRMGIDLLVSQQDECAKELFNILQMPGAQQVIDLMDGRAICVGLKLPTDSPLLWNPLLAFPNKEQLATIRFIAYKRGDKVFIPTGRTQFAIGDDIYLAGTPNAIKEFLAFTFPDETGFERVVVAGGGRLGLRLASLLERSNFDTILLEHNSEKAEKCSDQLENTLVIKGSAVSQESLEDLGINDKTAFVAATGDDEKNIMSCIMMEKMGAHFTAAKINKVDYAPIINSLSLLDRAVSPHTSLINSIYHFVRGQNIQADAYIEKVHGEIIEFSVTPVHAWNGQSIRDIRMPKGTIIALICRDDEVMVATGDIKLQTEDRLVIFAEQKIIKKLQNYFS